MTTKFKTIPSNPVFPEIEEEIINFWKDKKIFEKSVSSRSEKESYTFYDGPPFITGLPHHGSLLPSIAKDVIPRFWTMKGKRVERIWGWDCHGLPAENKVEEKLGLKSKKDIESIGIKKYIEECYSYVQNVSLEWEWYIDHIGRWVDFKNSYKTMDLSYMESVMWVFSELYKKNLVYKSRRTSLFCPRCSTPLSNFEIAMDNSYKMVEDPAISIKFKLTDRPAFIVAWTTTPWTLPGNLALAINQNEIYVEVKLNDENIILAKSRILDILDKQEYSVVREIKGQDLVGLSYEPLYSFYKTNENDYHIYHADFVSMEEGTGVVHIAPGFGEEDFQFGNKIGLSIIDHVDDDGKIVDQVTPFARLFVKKADPAVIDDLQKRNLLLKSEKISHSYPFCYRCDTPLIYKSQTAWYLNIEKLKPKMEETNEKINWVPPHIKHGRFGQGIASAPDWCLSRSRYWASPIPVWECQCGERFVPGSIAELEKRSGKTITNLHKPDIDEITITCEKCKQRVFRVPEVLDCWFESGSMPYAQKHYPFEFKDEFEKQFPSDYIVEYIAQTRGWFYTLHVLSNALFASQAFKNCIVTGVVMGTDGRKMSKLYKNYPDPKMVLQKYGGEAYRLSLMSSVVMVGENVNIDEKDFGDKVKNILLPLWNSLKYLITYAQMNNWEPEINQKTPPTHPLDLWIISKTNKLNQEFSQNLQDYNIPDAARLIQPYVDDLSKWYIRQSRNRFVNGDKIAMQTIWNCLIDFAKTTAPIIPFITEYIWQILVLPFNTKSPESIHLADYPSLKDTDSKLLEAMTTVREICEKGNMIRKSQNISTRQPLSTANVFTKNSKELNEALLEIIKNELNVKKIIIHESVETSIDINTDLTPELISEGVARDLIRQIQGLRKDLKLDLKDKIKIFAPSWPSVFESEILTKTLGTTIETSDTLKIEKIG